MLPDRICQAILDSQKCVVKAGKEQFLRGTVSSEATENWLMLGTILIIVLILLSDRRVAELAAQQRLGLWSERLLGTVLVVLLILVLMGRV